MKNAKVTIRPADVARVSFNNTFKVTPGQVNKLSVKTAYSVKLNDAAPTTAVFMYKFEACSEDNSIALSIETLSAITTSTFIDDLENVIKNQYMGVIMFSVNEKIRAIGQSFGITLSIPAATFPYGEQDEDGGNDSLDSILNTKI